MSAVDQNILQGLISPDEENRRRAIFLAAQALEFRAIPALTRLAGEDPVIELRYLAKKALLFLQQNVQRRQKAAGEAASPETGGIRPEVLRAELENPDPAVRNRVVQALARLGGPLALQLVAERVERETDPFVRASLAISLGVLGSRAQIPLLERLLSDENPRVRANAIEGLMHMGAPEAARLIAPHLKDTDNRVKVNAYTALGKFQKVDLLRALAEMMAADKVWLRDSATYALVKLELPESVPLLEHALADSWKGIRLKARNGLVLLAKKGVASALEVLRQAGGYRDSPDDYLTLELLDKSPAATTPQVSAAARLEAVLRIVRSQDRSRVDALVRQAAGEDDPKVLATLVLALGRLGDARCLPTLAGFLASRDRRVRANAVEALGLIGGTEALRVLAPHLDDPDNRVRANAVVALSALPGFDVTPALRSMAASNQELMRLSAVYALLVLRREDLGDCLAGLVGDGSPRVRKKAVDSLKLLATDGLPWAAATLRKAGIRLDEQGWR